MKIHLAPMEGILDSHMRAMLTHIGGYDACVTEFIRVVDRLHPRPVFYRYCPELRNGGKTASGVPVIIQLLGGIPEVVAMNAVRASKLGAPGIDINFGCPSRFVNRKAGGAVLLKEPQRVYDIVKATRQAVPEHIPVSAKIRLGYEDTLLALDNAQAVQDAGANYITVHARTKLDGYKPPARWEWLKKINDTLTIPMIANGDIMSNTDYELCKEISQCSDIMLGRGAIRFPDLAQHIKDPQRPPLAWPEVMAKVSELHYQLKQQTTITPRKALGRIKQWLSHLKLHYPEAQQTFAEVRLIKDALELEQWLSKQLSEHDD